MWRYTILVGWDGVVARLNKPAVIAWRAQVACGAIVTFTDIFIYSCCKRDVKNSSASTRSLLTGVWSAMVIFVAGLLERFVLEEYSRSHDLNSLPRLIQLPSKRHRGLIDGDSAWYVLERARKVFRATPELVVAVKSDDQHLSGVTSTTGTKWSATELELYYEKQFDAMHKCKKFHIAADPSTYSGQKTMVSIVWGHEAQRAAYPPIQVIPASTLMSPADMDMVDKLKALAMERKLERTSAYREFQALSHSMYLLTGHKLDDFTINPGISWKPSLRNEYRSVKDGKHVFCDRATKLVIRDVVPPGIDVGDGLQVTAGMDSGSIGRAAANFAVNKVNLNLFVIYDKIHRLIRDIKLSSEKTSSKELYKATLHTSFVFSLNQRPFGTGEWYEKKIEMLAHFMDCTTSDCPAFRRFAPLIARDLGVDLRCEADFANVYAMLPELPSFNNKGVCPKMMRWFSVNQSWHDQACEFNALKMVLQHAQGSEDCLLGVLEPQYSVPSVQAETLYKASQCFSSPKCSS